MDFTMKTICGYALTGVKHYIRDLQQEMIIQEAFKNDNMADINYSNPLDIEKQNFLAKNRKEHYDEAMEFYKKLQSFYTDRMDKLFNAGLDEIIREFKNSK